VLRADLPGVRPEDIRIQHLDGQVYIRAARRAEVPEGASWLVHQTPDGEFLRAFDAGVPVDQGGEHAGYDAGVLEVRLPKAEHARLRDVPVRVGPRWRDGRDRRRGRPRPRPHPAAAPRRCRPEPDGYAEGGRDPGRAVSLSTGGPNGSEDGGARGTGRVTTPHPRDRGCCVVTDGRGASSVHHRGGRRGLAHA